MTAQTTTLWSETSGSSASQQKSFVAVDLLGNIYQASSVAGVNGLDWQIVSWRPDSVFRWSLIIDGTGNQDDLPIGIKVDSAFNVFVCGIMRTANYEDISLLELDSSGSMIWQQNYNRTSGSHDFASSFDLVNGKIYVAGYSYVGIGTSDFLTLKYDTAGVLAWSKSFNGSANGDDRGISLIVSADGDVFVTGYAVTTGAANDIVTLKYDNMGQLQWTQNYGFIPSGNDEPCALTFDATGNVVVAGTSYKGPGNTDLVVVKYLASNGNQKWVARYNGTFNGNDGATGITADINNSIFVVGFSETGSGIRDFVTIRYHQNGNVKWLQRYDGTVNGDDIARAALIDGEDIVVSGQSMGVKNYDAITISYSIQTGQINWVNRYDAVFGEQEDVTSLTRDEMGNILLGVYERTGVFLFAPAVLKLNQYEKNVEAMKRDGRLLMYACLAIRADTAARRWLFEDLGTSLDSFYFEPFERYLLLMADVGHPMEIAMNDSLRNHSVWSHVQPLSIVQNRMFERNVRFLPSIYVQDFDLFDLAHFHAGEMHIASEIFDDSFPIESVTKEGGVIDSASISQFPTLIVVTNLTFVLGKNSDCICKCWAKLHLNTDRCWVCNPQPVGPLPEATVLTNNVGDWEIGIWQGINDPNNPLWESDGYTACMEVYDYAGSLSIDHNYLELATIPGFDYYSVDEITSNHIGASKVTGAINDRSSGRYENKMTLCGLIHKFNNFGENLYPLALAQQGIYQIHRPGMNMQPVYFAFPFSAGLWYTDGPDLNIMYSTDDPFASGNYCLPGLITAQQVFAIGPNNVLGNGQWLYGLSPSGERNVIATTDYATISSFWLDNVVTVGFLNENDVTHDALNNAYIFYANSNGQFCNPTAIYPNAPIVCSLVLSSNGIYEIKDYFSGGAGFRPYEVLLIHVRANFDNGESIDECRVISLNPNASNPNNDFKAVTVDFRGNIKDFDVNVVNYQVDVYDI